MENADSVPKESITKKCPHCQKDIAANAKKCPYCQTDLRSWINRHPIITTLLVIVVVLFALGNIGNATAPSSASQNSTPTDTVNSLMAQNNPTIKVLGTFPTNHIGKTFTLYVYAQTDRYYNYGFQDENAWYSLKLWDNSVPGEFEGVYAYVPKTAANKDLVDRALNNPVFIKVTVTVPADKWQDGSNAFLQINSWSFQ